MEKRYIVYKHTCPNGKCYIGVTGQSVEKRWKYGRGYDTQLFGFAVRKYGWASIQHKVLFDGLTLEDAYKHEKNSILKYKSFDPQYGYNCDMGGAGSECHSVSQEFRKAASERAKKMWENEKTREVLLVHLRGLNASRVGQKMPQNAVRKSAVARGKAVEQLDAFGNVIATFKTAMDAARSVGKEQNVLILRSCKNQKYSAYGYKWRYVDAF